MFYVLKDNKESDSTNKQKTLAYIFHPFDNNMTIQIFSMKLRRFICVISRNINNIFKEEGNKYNTFICTNKRRGCFILINKMASSAHFNM